MKYKVVQIFSFIQFEVHDNSHLLPRRGQSTSKNQPQDSNNEYDPHKDAKVTKPPKKTSRVTKSYIYELTTYAINQAKWKAAQEYCLDRRIEFKLITEDELGIK